MSFVKGLATTPKQYDGAPLRVAIVHARWNKTVIDALVEGALGKLKESGVRPENVVVQEVPGSFELPLACSRMIAASQIQASSIATDLMGTASSLLSTLTPSSEPPPPPPPTTTSSSKPTASQQPFDAIIAIGVLIKGSTMHFEYICDAVSHALMRLQMDTGVPVIFGVLTVLTDDQALERAGIGRGEARGHNHGEDWGLAAVEMGCQARKWAEGKFE